MTHFGIKPGDKVAAFIDGPNFYATAKSLQADIDYTALRKLLDEDGGLIRIYYYTAVADNNEEFNGVKPLLDYLDYNGFNVVTKATKTFTDSLGQRKVKGNLDVELTCDMLDLADRVDHIVLFSGDGDFVRAIKDVQRKAVKVTVVSTITSSPPMISDDLRRAADAFVDLNKIIPLIQRKDRVDRDDRSGVERTTRTSVRPTVVQR